MGGFNGQNRVMFPFRSFPGQESSRLCGVGMSWGRKSECLFALGNASFFTSGSGAEKNGMGKKMATGNLTAQFKCKNGETVRIVIADNGYVAHVFSADNLDIGKLEFVEYDDNVLHLVWAHLEGDEGRFVRQGIGRECLRLMSETYGMPIVVNRDDGIRRDDGSHLTGDAPAFVEAMRREGLVTYLGGYDGREIEEI